MTRVLDLFAIFFVGFFFGYPIVLPKAEQGVKQGVRMKWDKSRQSCF